MVNDDGVRIMASGDIFSNTSITLPFGDIVAIQPAAGLQVCLTSFWASDNNIKFSGGESTGIGVSFAAPAVGTSTEWRYLGVNSKIFLTNSEFIYAWNDHSSVNYTFGYTGMEI